MEGQWTVFHGVVIITPEDRIPSYSTCLFTILFSVNRLSAALRNSVERNYSHIPL